MSKKSGPRHGSLQFYPRVRAKKILPRVSWNSLSKEGGGVLGFIGYKVGMKSAFVKDNTSHSLTKGQRITFPVTIIECPTIKILSVRFYKNNIVVGEVLNENIDKELKKKIKIPKKKKKKIEDFKEEEYDNIRVIIYSQVKKTGIKKTPDMTEIGLSGTLSEKLEFIKNNLSKEISIKDFITEGLVDIRGVTKGKGTQGPTKRFGLALKSHKSEKGQRGPGTGGSWHPARVEFMQPMAGQMGFFTRAVYNNKIIEINNIKDKDINPKQGFRHFGKIKTDYLIVYGSVQGPAKRQLLITVPLRANKNQIKKNYELLELR
jgi:large subunit ribosomal protein L3